jgi:HEPN domain-containing protein
MSDRQPEHDIASRWRREASEELRAAEVVAAHDEVPDRVAGFHAHLAAEKALKSLLIDRGVEVPRIHDLIGLHRLLPEMDQARFDPDRS